MNQPLAHLLRPKTIDEIVGQEHLLGKGGPLRKLIESDKLSSMILMGPAGTGKTTLAECIALRTKARFVNLNATSAGVKDIRKEGQKAMDQRTQVVLFLDEAHRATAVQQDALLPYVENGSLIFIGATTDNVFFSLRSPLISRSIVFTLEKLGKKDLVKLIIKAIEYYKKTGREIEIDQDAIKHIIKVSCGDGRKCLTILEMAVAISEGVVDLKAAETAAPSKYSVLTEDGHFDLASWMQGAIQASDPDSAVFALAKWLESGEDPRYIARRILVAASEDCSGNPEVAAVAHNAFIAACEIGRPECDIILSHAVVLAASSPRDKSAAKAIWAAVKDVKDNLDIEVPKSMRDSHYCGADKLGLGAYKEGMNPEAYVGIGKKYYWPPQTSKYQNPMKES